MSLINKMLQDLDARGSQGAAATQAEIKPVPRTERAIPLPLVIGGALGAAALAVAGVFGWRYWQQRPVAAPVASVVQVAPVPQAVPATVPTAVPTAVPTPAPAPVVAAVAAPVPASAEPVEPVVKAAPIALAAKPVPQVRVEPRAAAEAPPARRAPAEDDYRRALGSLQDGRVDEAIGQLEQALRVDPKHEAARQTLVGLLIEDKRSADAVRVLQAGLALDVKQPALAMLLARLQIQAGASGVDTLQRSLPAALGNADYHAFLAGALQRDQRHREAAEQYVAALRLTPDNGVWLMGLGISLLADKRPADALDAFQRASATDTLSPELQSFVDRKISQLK